MPNKVSVISHEYIEPNTDQGSRRGRDEDATPARATAWRQRIGRWRHEDWSRRFALLRRPRKLSLVTSRGLPSSVRRIEQLVTKRDTSRM